MLSKHTWASFVIVGTSSSSLSSLDSSFNADILIIFKILSFKSGLSYKTSTNQPVFFSAAILLISNVLVDLYVHIAFNNA